MGAIAMRIRSKKGVPVLQRGLAVLRKYGANAHLWVPGVGAINGQDIGNYLDSAGTTAASVDNPIGLVLDQLFGGGALGSNMIINSDFSAAGANWAGGAGWSVIAGSATHASAGGASALSQGGLTIGVMYKATVYSPNPVAFNAVFGGTYQSITWNGNVGTAFGVCTSSTTFGVQGGGDITITKVVVQPVLGIAATQPTTANKPTLRRGVTNLQTYSNALTNAAWQRNNAAVTGGQPDPSGGNAAFLLSATQGASSYINNAVSLTNGQVYTRAVIAKAGSTAGLYLEVGNNGGYFAAKFDLASGVVTGGSYTSTSMTALGNGYFLCLATWTAGATGSQTANAVYIDNYGAALGNTNLTIYASGVFPGVVSAQQIAQCGGIPPTTSAPASSASGNWGWEGDGNSKYLPLASLPFLMSDDHIVVAGGRCDSATADRSFFGIRSTSSAAPIVGQLGFTAGNPDAVWRDDSGALFRATAGTPRVGQPCVLSLRKTGGAGVLRVNGTQAASVALTPGATTVNAAAIGGVTTTAPGNLLPGVTNLVIGIRGTVSDVDLLTLERMVGALTGPTGVIF